MHGKEGYAWQREACVVGGNICGRGCLWQGHVWLGVCTAGHMCDREGCVAGGGMHGRACKTGAMHGRRGSHGSGLYTPYLNASLLRPTNKVCRGYVFTLVCHSVHRRGVFGQVPPPTGTSNTQPPNQVHPLDQVHSLGPGTPPKTRYPSAQN